MPDSFSLTQLPSSLSRLEYQSPATISEVLLFLQYAIRVVRSILFSLLLPINRFVTLNFYDLEIFSTRHLDVLRFHVPALVKNTLGNERIVGNWMGNME